MKFLALTAVAAALSSLASAIPTRRDEVTSADEVTKPAFTGTLVSYPSTVAQGQNISVAYDTSVRRLNSFCPTTRTDILSSRVRCRHTTPRRITRPRSAASTSVCKDPHPSSSSRTRSCPTGSSLSLTGSTREARAGGSTRASRCRVPCTSLENTVGSRSLPSRPGRSRPPSRAAVLIVTEHQLAIYDSEAPTYRVQSYNVSVQVTEDEEQS